MRPIVLTPIFAALRSFDGVGPRNEKLFTKLLGDGADGSGPRVIDLLFHLPTGLIDRSRRITAKDARALEGEIATLTVRVAAHVPSPRRGVPHRVTTEDQTGELDIVFFHGDRKYIERLLPAGATRILSGRIELYGGIPQIVHPDHIVAAESGDELPALEPVYPLTAGLSGKVLRKVMGQCLARVPRLAEWRVGGEGIVSGLVPSFAEALRALHEPDDAAALDSDPPERRHLAADELLAHQLALALVRLKLRKSKGRSLPGTGALRDRIIDALPFVLTGAQTHAIEVIATDMESPSRMIRLLQGDVGSGKTVVALLAMAQAVEAGAQAALMAPTDILARQHFSTLTRLAADTPIKIALLTGRSKSREEALGDAEIVVGTHALFQDAVSFRDLGLVVIDEQHRFGVHQRLALQAKAGEAQPDMLAMTATPIPRTLALSHYGDMDMSALDEKPAGRQPITTRVLPIERIGDVIDGLKRAIAGGAQIYWVCPLVEETATLDVSAAQERHTTLVKRLGPRVGLVHGRQKPREKDAAMAAFAAGALDVLVATTVIEVGVDVPNATVMVIEHAERFGLAQLHQLRGRVGRGANASSCVLLYKGPLTEAALARLEILRETEDGFRIAEEDMRLRGAGDALGARQSGLPAFRIARLPEDEALLIAARDDARSIIADDPELHSPRGEALRTLLYLFERDDAIRLLKSG